MGHGIEEVEIIRRQINLAINLPYSLLRQKTTQEFKRTNLYLRLLRQVENDVLFFFFLFAKQVENDVSIDCYRRLYTNANC